MNHLNRILVLFAAISVFAGQSSPAYADLVRYSYSGNTFDPIEIYNDPNYGPLYGYPYGSGVVHRLSIEFTLDDSLVPKNGTFDMPWSGTTAVNFPLANFLITDGAIGASYNANSNLPDISNIKLIFNTDAEGNIDGGWDISASHYCCNFRMYNYYLGSIYNASANSGRDFASIITSAPGMAYSLETINNPGTWTRTLVPVPLPGAILLFGSALLSGLRLSRRSSNFSDL
jgi:hypothetical protein